MVRFKISFIVFGLWIGVLLTGSIVLELWLQGQIYSTRTVTIVAIMGIAGVFSSAVSWYFFSRFDRSILRTSMILIVINVILFCLIGTLISYIVTIAIPHFVDPSTVEGHDNSSIADFLRGTAMGFLGSGFSFKTFGLPLLWPFGAISGGIGTFIYVIFNKMLNSRAHH